MYNFIGFFASQGEAEREAGQAGFGTKGVGGAFPPYEVGTTYWPLDPTTNKPIGWPRTWIRDEDGTEGWQEGSGTSWMFNRVADTSTINLTFQGGRLSGDVTPRTVDAATVEGMTVAHIINLADDKTEKIIDLFRPISINWHPNKGPQTGENVGVRQQAQFVGQWLQQWIKTKHYSHVKLWVAGSTGVNTVWHPVRTY